MKNLGCFCLLFLWTLVVFEAEGQVSQEEDVEFNEADYDYEDERCVDIHDCEYMAWLMKNKSKVGATAMMIKVLRHANRLFPSFIYN